jgi:hypothetical protein
MPPAKADGQAHPNSLFNGSLTPTQLAAEVGHCLRSHYSGVLDEPVPNELTILVRRLQESEEGASSPGPSKADAKPPEP